MPAIAHRNCRLPGKTRAATGPRQLRDTNWRERQPQHQGHLAHTRDGIGTNQGKNTTTSQIFKLSYSISHPTKKDLIFPKLNLAL